MAEWAAWVLWAAWECQVQAVLAQAEQVVLAVQALAEQAVQVLVLALEWVPVQEWEEAHSEEWTQ